MSSNPDLTHLDFFLWGHVKKVLPTRPIKDLLTRILATCDSVRRIPALAARQMT